MSSTIQTIAVAARRTTLSNPPNVRGDAGYWGGCRSERRAFPCTQLHSSHLDQMIGPGVGASAADSALWVGMPIITTRAKA